MMEFERRQPEKTIQQLVDEAVGQLRQFNPEAVKTDGLDKRNWRGNGDVITTTSFELLGWYRVRDTLPKYRFKQARLVHRQTDHYERKAYVDSSFQYSLQLVPTNSDNGETEEYEFGPLSDLPEDSVIVRALRSHLESLEEKTKGAGQAAEEELMRWQISETLDDLVDKVGLRTARDILWLLTDPKFLEKIRSYRRGDVAEFKNYKQD